MTWGEAFEDAQGAPVATAAETAAAWFAQLSDILDELAMRGRSQWEAQAYRLGGPAGGGAGRGHCGWRGMTFEAAKDRRGRWGVFDTVARVWYYPIKGGRIAAQAWAEELNK